MITMITNLYHGNSYVKNLVTMAEENVKLLQRKYPGEKAEYLFINDSPEDTVTLPDSPILSIKEVPNEKNQGIHGAKVKALEEAMGEYVLFLDQDDKIMPDCLLAHYENMPDIDVSVSNGYRVYGDRLEPLYSRKLAKKMLHHKWCYIYGTDLIFSMGQCMIRKSAIPDYWKEHILQVNGSDDFYLWLCMFGEGKGFRFLEKALYNHMETKINYSNDKEKMDASYEKMCELLSGNPAIASKDIAVLKKRLIYKRLCQNSDVPKWKKCVASIRNFKTVLTVLLYKVGGYQ